MIHTTSSIDSLLLVILPLRIEDAYFVVVLPLGFAYFQFAVGTFLNSHGLAFFVDNIFSLVILSNFHVRVQGTLNFGLLLNLRLKVGQILFV